MIAARKSAAAAPVVLFTSPTAPLPLSDSHVYPPMPAPAPLSLYGQVMYPPVVPAVPNIVTVVPLTVPAVPNIVTVVPPIVPTIPSLPIVFGVGVKRRHDEFDADSSSDNSNHRAPAKQAPKTPVHNVSASDSDDCSCSSSGSQTSDNVTTKKKVQKMPRITKEERTSVCDWIQKERSDGKMLNGRWIRNGGAKGATMTATSAEVKTSGAYDSFNVVVVADVLLFHHLMPAQVRQQKIAQHQDRSLDEGSCQKKMDGIVGGKLCLLFCFK